jgi:hypothetical protein
MSTLDVPRALVQGQRHITGLIGPLKLAEPPYARLFFQIGLLHRAIPGGFLPTGWRSP